MRSDQWQEAVTDTLSRCRHLPHGFYEDPLRKFFSQFGTVTNLRLSRNKSTGKSKHYAFLEFQSPEVAAIAAEAMDGYFMFKHKLVCQLVAPGKVHEELWKGGNAKFRPPPRQKLERLRLEKPRTPAELVRCNPACYMHVVLRAHTCHCAAGAPGRAQQAARRRAAQQAGRSRHRVRLARARQHGASASRGAPEEAQAARRAASAARAAGPRRGRAPEAAKDTAQGCCRARIRADGCSPAAQQTAARGRRAAASRASKAAQEGQGT